MIWIAMEDFFSLISNRHLTQEHVKAALTEEDEEEEEGKLLACIALISFM